MTSQAVPMVCKEASLDINLPKHRFPNVLPYDVSRVKLRDTGKEGSDFINASNIDGYRQRGAYLATQGMSG